MDLHSEIKTAIEYHQHGDLPSAGAIYDAILKTDPNHTKILHLAGVLAQQTGELKKARRLIARTVSIEPENGEYLVSLAAVLKAEGRLYAAREALEKAVALVPPDADIINELGDIANTVGDYPAAVGYFTKAVSMAADVAACHFNLGLAHRNQGNHALALSCFKKALQLDPGLIQAQYAMGNLMQDSGDFDAAIDCYRQVLQLSPGFAEAHYNMGNAARSAGNPQLAADCFRRTLDIQPDCAEAHNNLGLIFKDDGSFSRAVAHFEKALHFKPHLAEAKFNMGVTAQLRGNHEAGLKWFRETLQIRPDYAPAQWMWHLSLPILYKNPEEIERYRQRFKTHLALLIDGTRLKTARDIETAVEGVGSMTNFYLQYQGRNDRELQTLYGDFVSKVMMNAYPQWCEAKPMPQLPVGAKIRIGYVSSFMRAHTIGEFLAGWLEHHDHAKFEIHCYHIGTQTDIMTPRFARHSTAFHQIGDDLQKAATLIRAHDLHILVYTDIGMNALATQLAALRLAPIQCKGWGHPVTTGLPTIDYYLSSDLMEPADGRDHYSETLIRLPNLALAYTPPSPPQHPKTRSDFGLREDARVCLTTQSLFKYLPQHDDIYPRIARQVANVQFAFLAHKSPDITEQFTTRLAKAFAAHGLNHEDYCRVVPQQSFPDFLSLNLCCDLLLDSMEWSGGKTTLEAISCGLPVVTRPGNLMRGRHAYAMLAMMGIDDTIAKDKDEYIQIAVKLCSDEHFYAGVKAQVAGKRARLYADSGCIRALENFYRCVCRPMRPKMVIKEEISLQKVKRPLPAKQSLGTAKQA